MTAIVSDLTYVIVNQKWHYVCVFVDLFNREIVGCTYDNAVAEATFKIIKTEFVKDRQFDSLEELTRELYEYIHWFNYIRIHGTLGYVCLVEYKLKHLKKIV